MTSPNADRGGPLAGLRVLEITKVWAGPYAGKLLAFLGAEVIKVESLTNLDEMRAYGGVDINSAPYFLSINQEVQSVQVNMKSAEGMDMLKQMIAQCDVLLDNLRPGAMERLGLSYDDVCRIRPDIIQLSIKMYGTDGPLGYQTGYAPCFAALGGLTSLVGHKGQTPKGMNIRYGDSTVGASAAFAIIAALHHRAQTGEGQFIDLSAVETQSTMIGDSLLAYAMSGEVPIPAANDHPSMAPHGCYQCGDGQWLSLAVASDEEWHRLCQVMDLVWPEFDNNEARLAAPQALDSLLAQAIAKWDHAPLMQQLRDADVAAYPSQSSLDLLSDALLWETGVYRLVHDSEDNARPIIAAGWSMTPEEATITRAAPKLGEHNDYVYGELLGFSNEEIADLKHRGVIH